MVFLKRLNKKQVMSLMPADLKDEEKKSWLEPFDYEKVFEPKTAEALRKLYGGAAVGGDDDDTGETGGDGGIDDLVGDTGGDDNGDDDLGGDNGGDEFDEDTIRDELEEKNRKGLEKFIVAEELKDTVKYNKKTKDATLVEKIINALRERFEAGEGGEETGGEDDGGEETGGGDDDGELDIDDLV